MTIDEFNWQAEVGAHWFQYVEAAGLADPTHEIGDIFLLAGLIMHDQVVTDRFAGRMRGWRPPESEAAPAPKSRNAYIEILLAMNAEEKRALRDRVLPQLVRSRRFMEGRKP